jgi:hypothetical protein
LSFLRLSVAQNNSLTGVSVCSVKSTWHKSISMQWICCFYNAIFFKSEWTIFTSVFSICPRVKDIKRVEMLPVLKMDVQGFLCEGNSTKMHHTQGTNITQTNFINFFVINYVFLFLKKLRTSFHLVSWEMRN